MHAYLLKSTLHMGSQLESLNFSIDLLCIDGSFMDPMCIDYDKLSVIFDKLLIEISSYQAYGVLSIIWLVMSASSACFKCLFV